MKYFFAFLLVCSFLPDVMGQQPTAIKEFYRDPRPYSYYMKQVQLWKSEVSRKQNIKNPLYWKMYARASFYASMGLDASTLYRNLDEVRKHERKYELDNEQRTPVSIEEEFDINADYELMKKQISETFDFEFVRLKYLQREDAKINDPNIPLQLAPRHPDMFIYRVRLLQTAKEYDQLSKLLTAYYNSNYFPREIMEYAYNLLMSVEKDAILITDGIDETYPALMWQYIKQEREDVTIVDLGEMINNPGHMGWEILGLEYQEVQLTKKNLLQKIFDVGKNDRIRYVSGPLLRLINEDQYNHFYCEGLAFKYSEVPYDADQYLEAHLSTRFLGGFLEEQELNTEYENWIRYRYQLYLDPLIKLHRYYIKSSKAEQAKSLKVDILYLADLCDLRFRVEEMIK